MPSDMHNGALSIAERKRLLIAQGASHRLAITHARIDVRASLSAESLTKSVFNHVVMGAITAFKGGALLKSGGSLLKGSNLQVLLPLAMSIFSRVSKKSHLAKPIARGVLVMGAVAAIARFVIRKKNVNKMKQR
jgi:hypothetical protein